MKDHFGIAEEREGCLKTMPKKVKRKKPMAIYVLCMKNLPVAEALYYCNRRMANKLAEQKDMKVVKFIECLTD